MPCRCTSSILRPGLAQRAIFPRSFAFLQHLQGAAHADEIGGQIGEQRDAVVQPGRLDQHMVREHVAARAGERRDRAVHAGHQLPPDAAGLHRAAQHVVPQRLA